MAKNRLEIINEIIEWKQMLSGTDTIPLNAHHTYKDQTDVYERLTEYVKGWVEGMFGVYTKEDGSLENLPSEQDSEASKEWLSGVKGRLSPLCEDWYQVALNGPKKQKIVISEAPQQIEGLNEGLHENVVQNGTVQSVIERESSPLPALNMRTATLNQIIKPSKNGSNKTNTDKAMKNAQEDICYEVQTAFFPAYRALRDSFEKRWFFEWIFNHKRYVAERDALKVMTNLIKSMTGYTKEELDKEYKSQKQSISAEHIAAEERAHKAPKKEAQGEEKDQQLNDELGKGENINPLDQAISQIQEVGIEIDTAVQKFEKLDQDEEVFFQQLVHDLAKGVQGAGVNKSACKESIPQHIYMPLSKEAKNLCTMYDSVCATKNTQPEHFKNEVSKAAMQTAEKMFQKAFKEFGSKASGGVEVFGDMALKDRIISAQKVTDIMLNKMTPVGFESKQFGHLAKGYYTLENSDKIRDFIKTSVGGQYNENEIDAAMTAAKKEFGILYRGERPQEPQVFEIGYRPNLDNIKREGKVLVEAQRLVRGENAVIKNEALRAIISENCRRWNSVKDELGSVVKKDVKAQLIKTWEANEEKFKKLYPDYDPKASENLINETVAKMKGASKGTEQLNIELNEQKTSIVPPVKVAKLNNPVNEKHK